MKFKMVFLLAHLHHNHSRAGQFKDAIIVETLLYAEAHRSAHLREDEKNVNETKQPIEEFILRILKEV